MRLPPGPGGGPPPREGRCEELGPPAAGQGARRAGRRRTSRLLSTTVCSRGVRVGRARVVRAGRGRRGLEKKASAKPAAAPRAEDRWSRGHRQVANCSGAAQRGPNASPAPRPGSLLPAAGATWSKLNRRWPHPPVGAPGPLASCSPLPSGSARCPRRDPRARCWLGAQQGRAWLMAPRSGAAQARAPSWLGPGVRVSGRRARSWQWEPPGPRRRRRRRSRRRRKRSRWRGPERLVPSGPRAGATAGPPRQQSLEPRVPRCAVRGSLPAQFPRWGLCRRRCQGRTKAH